MHGKCKSEAVAAHVLKKLLLPGEICTSALAETLTELGKPTTKEQLSSRLASQLVDFLVSVRKSLFVRTLHCIVFKALAVADLADHNDGTCEFRSGPFERCSADHPQ